MQQRSYRYLDVITVAFITVLLCANVIGAGKVANIGGLSLTVAVLIFPASYLFGDILTEVYGYAHARRVMWLGFGAMLIALVVSTVTVVTPPAAGWPNQAAYETVFGQVPRIAVASVIAFWCGGFINAYVLAKMKVMTEGRALYLRTIASTVLGEAIDTVLFFLVAFFGVWGNDLLMNVMWSEYVVKVGWEVAATPLTYVVVRWLKRAEHEDHFDRGTNFTPFRLKA
jgi:uncharacterized integral membrane protein (TIGR00697 family)